MFGKKPLIIQLANLLHRYKDPDHKKIRQFVEQNSDNSKFVERANKLRKLFRQVKDILLQDEVEREAGF